MDPSSNRYLNMIVQRQLDTITTGNAAYLIYLLECAKSAGLQIRYVFAPWRSFGNRPWASIHPAFADLGSDVVWPRAIRIDGRYWSLSARVWIRFLVRLVKAGFQKLGVPARVHSFLGDPLSREEQRITVRATNTNAAVVAIAEYSSLGPVLEDIDSAVAKGVLLHDLFSLRAEAFKSRGQAPDFLDVSREEEASRCRFADVLIFGSANEMGVLSKLLPDAQSIWLRPEPPAYSVGEAQDSPKAVFLGTRHAGNVDALHHLLDAIWPLVLRARPDAELLVAGSICKDVSASQASLSGVRLLGRVERLESLGGANSIGLAPTKLASGVSIKVAEYLMLGMPTVVLPVALEGFGDALSSLVSVTDSPEAFAEEVTRLMSDARAREDMSMRGLAETPAILDNSDMTEWLRRPVRN